MAASEPTSSLSLTIDTFHPLTLSQHLGTLTIVWVVPLSETKLTPGFPSPKIFDANIFGVGRKMDPFRDLNLKSVALHY